MILVVVVAGFLDERLRDETAGYQHENDSKIFSSEQRDPPRNASLDSTRKDRLGRGARRDRGSCF